MNKKIKVVFFDSSHSYYAIDESLIENGRISFRGKKDPTNLGIRKLSSVGKFFGKYFPEYDSNYWLTYKGLEFANKDVFDEIKSANFKGIGAPRAELFFPMLFDKIDPNVFQDKRQLFSEFWDFKRENSAFLGTQFHLNQEKKHEKNGFIINPFTEEKFKLITHNKIFDNESVVYNLKDLEDGAYSEILLFDLEVGVAGQVDELFVKTIKKKKNIWINDFKGLCLDTPIATKSGWKKMKDIEVGDSIFDGNGELTTVSAVSDVHFNPCFKINFDTNDSIICDHEHRWVVDVEGSYGYEETELTTDDLYKLYLDGNKLKIPCVGIRGNHLKKLPIDPYVLGVWLGDGNRCCGAITNENENIWKEIENRGYKVGNNFNENNGKSMTKTVYGLEHHLRKLKLLKNKHIPNLYLRSSYNDRLDLLRGFMDADGFLNKTRKSCVMSTTQKWQAESISTLISSLGFKPIIMSINVSGFGLKKKGYSVSFSPSINPFLSRNKDYDLMVSSIEHRRKIRSKNRYITSIEIIETVPTKCLAVDSPSHTYLAGYNFIKTHNTNEEKPDKSNMQKAYPPLDELDNCKHNKYSMQLSSYAYILERAGCVIQDLAYTFYKDYNEECYETVKVEYFRDFCENIFQKP